MQRKVVQEIEKWNKKVRRKPLVLLGARQVGKTWLMDEFARTTYGENVVKVNFMKSRRLREVMSHADLAADTVVENIQLITGKKIVPGKTLLVMDEIQESPQALTSLKFFNEDMPELAIIAAGSLLGLSIGKAGENGADNEQRSRGSFPVGKIDRINVNPMSFSEFLLATGKEMLVELIAQRNWRKLSCVREACVEALKAYLVVGGMPEAVKTYVETGHFDVVRECQETILADYDDDFAKHAPAALLPKIRLLWSNIPSQLAKENRKFIYSALKSGARAREYEMALQWLDDAGMIRQIYRADPPRLPLKTYRDFSAFKLYMHDVGLLGAMSGLDPSAVIDGDALFTNFKGSLTEQYVLQELIAGGIEPCYWSADAGDAEVEFVVQCRHAVIPVEAKAGINTKAKSLRVYQMAFAPPFAVRTSLADAHEGQSIKDVPLYAFGSCFEMFQKTAGGSFL